MTPKDKGFKDFRAGQLINPYTEGTIRYKNWEFGFNKAYFINLERVKEREGYRDQRLQSSQRS